MIYRKNPKNGDEISQLGFGCMRFHKDDAEVERQVRRAIENGVNYFDTAYIYPGSEAILGRILAKDGLRDKIYLATKLPQSMVRKTPDFDKYFSAQLERLKTDRIDYYLLHMLTGLADWSRLKNLGLADWMEEKKRTGKIRNMGFSFHGPQSEFKAILDAYDWDCCLIQYNWYDEFNQAGRGGLEYAGRKGVPVMIMEPLRGGRLVNNLPESAESVFKSGDKERSLADWGLRWVYNHPEVTCVLSGMNSMEMVEGNIATASDAEAGALSSSELELFKKVREQMMAATRVPCTGCGYCMPCPRGVDIPACFTRLNDLGSSGKIMTKYWYAITVKDRNASKCIKCGKCEEHCPQLIEIREKLSETRRELEGFPYGVIKSFARRFMHVGE